MYFESTELSGAAAGTEIAAVEPSSSPAAEQIALAGAPSSLVPALQRRGFLRLTEVQRAVLDADDGKSDLRITSQTGSGKTVALGFALAAGLTDGRRNGPNTLVIAPTRELAMQVKEELGWLFADLPHVHCEVVTGGTSLMRERQQLKRRPAIVVGTPGRLLDHLRQGVLDVTSVTQLVLDEADQMLDLGFKDELDGILEQIPAARRTHLVSATFPREVLDLANRFQRQPIFVEGSAHGVAHDDIEHVVHRIGPREHYAALVNILLMAGDERTLVFVRTRENTATLADKLAADGFAALAINGDLAQAQRTRTLESFRRGAVRTLIATDVAARGLDISSVTAVVHVHPPIDSATYVHRSGRTGRAGQKGRSIMLVPKGAEHRVRRLYREAKLEPTLEPLPSAREVLQRQLERATAAARATIEASPQPGTEQLAAAETLLLGRAPAAVVAALLTQSMATLRAPFDVGDGPSHQAPRLTPRHSTIGHSIEGPAAPAQHQAPPPPPVHRRLPAGRLGKPGAPPAWRRDPDAPEPPRSRAPARNGAFARFRINWGLRDGADARRILAHVCRRGDVDSRMIGGIDLQQSSSTFEVAEAIARAFAKRVQKRDRRDPHLFIVPDDRG
ncbi:MAG: DEAD/DEAH box helicase [Planctomycetes bacterium]|nr:DEAD/DEAH box helicase [Planctomycetota bacterium]